MLLAADRDDDLIQMPFVAELGRATANRPGEIPPEFLSSAPHGLMADDNAAGGQQIFDHSQTERKAEIEPDRLANDLGGKPVTAIKGIPNLAHAAGVARQLTWVST